MINCDSGSIDGTPEAFLVAAERYPDRIGREHFLTGYLPRYIALPWLTARLELT